jgi:nitrate reductase gamma subunit
MNNLSRLYEFLAGPCLYITLPLCLAGLARKTVIIISGRRNGLRFLTPHTRKYIPSDFEDGEPVISSVAFIRRATLLAVTSIIFHISIIAAPLSAAAHAVLFDQAWFLMPQRVDPAVTGALTVTAIVSGSILLLRRAVFRHVAAVSSWKDYTAMLCVLIPFVTGLLARTLAGPYEIIIIIHVAGAHMLLVAIGWTRLGHMIFFSSALFAKNDLAGEMKA